MSNLTTPSPRDAYSRFFVDMFSDQTIIGVPTVFQSLFGRPQSGAQDRYPDSALVVDIDIIKGNERTAALIERGQMSTDLSKKFSVSQKFSSFARTFPLVEETTPINAHQLLQRLAGENPEANADRLSRLRTLARASVDEHIRRMVRTFEYLAAQSVLVGKQPILYGAAATDLLIDFKRNADNLITVTTPWTDAAADILSDIDDGLDQLRRAGHVNGDYAIMDRKSMEAIINDSDIQTVADNRRFELIEVNQNMPVPPSLSFLIDSGATPRGRLRTPGGHNIWMFTYIDEYTDEAGDQQLYLPEGTVLLGYSGARCDRYFGPGELLPLVPMREQLYMQLFGFSTSMISVPSQVKGTVVNPAMFYNDAYYSSDWKSVVLRTQAAPIFSTTHTDAFVTLSGTVV
jgi:hypothetical protein